jgi:hypothetical protein
MDIDIDRLADWLEEEAEADAELEEEADADLIVSPVTCREVKLERFREVAKS